MRHSDVTVEMRKWPPFRRRICVDTPPAPHIFSFDCSNPRQMVSVCQVSARLNADDEDWPASTSSQPVAYLNTGIGLAFGTHKRPGLCDRVPFHLWPKAATSSSGHDDAPARARGIVLFECRLCCPGEILKGTHMCQLVNAVVP